MLNICTPVTACSMERSAMRARCTSAAASWPTFAPRNIAVQLA